MRPAMPLLLATALVAGTAHAHGMRSAALQLDEVAEGRAQLRLTTAAAAELSPELPPECRAVEQEAGGKGSLSRLWLVDCARPLPGLTFGLRGLGPVVTDATLLVNFRDGSSASAVLLPESPRFLLPADEGALAVARGYLWLGVLHILSGPDHLLFLVLLLLAARARLRPLLLAESAFTLSHSLSFSATALGLVHVPAAAAEACIALSLLLMALDVEAGRAQGRRELALSALVFGSVHGLGFAGGLRELGLPERHVATALLGFGGGVELGQLAFLGLVLLLVRAASRLRWQVPAARATACAGGVAASYWLLQRVAACLS